MELHSDETPKWDVALAALLNEEHAKKNAGLVLDDLQSMAKQHGIRFDDIMDTLLIMCAEHAWEYQDKNGLIKPICHADIDELFSHGRLREEDVNAFIGTWQRC